MGEAGWTVTDWIGNGVMEQVSKRYTTIDDHLRTAFKS